MKIDDTPPQSQVISYSKCRAKTGNKSKFKGEETNNGCEGDKQIKEVFDAWKVLNAKFENAFVESWLDLAVATLLQGLNHHDRVTSKQSLYVAFLYFFKKLAHS